MPLNDIYRRQATFLVQLLPTIATENIFALKGGTAINLFVRDMPRISVDIDLTYIPIAPRAKSLEQINTALGRITQRLRTTPLADTVIEHAPTKGEPQSRDSLRANTCRLFSRPLRRKDRRSPRPPAST